MNFPSNTSHDYTRKVVGQSDLSWGKLTRNWNRVYSNKLASIPGNHLPKIKTDYEN